MATMAKSRKHVGRPKGPEPPRQIIASFKGTADYAAWFDSLVEHCRDKSGWSALPAAAVVERALACLAKEQGFDEPPPKR